MGDRVLLQVVKKSPEEFSPVIYCHWLGGCGAIDAVTRLKARMEGRSGDVPYATARLVQEVINNDNGNLSFGVWNAEKVLTAEDSHGDAGVILVNADTFEMTFLGGYLPHGDGS